MEALQIVNLIISTGTLAGVVRLVWLLSHHDTMLRVHTKQIDKLLARVERLELKEG